MDWIKKHKIITVVLVIVILGAIGASSPKKETTKPSSSTTTTTAKKTEPAKPKFDIAAFYAKVENGMTKEQVIAAAGKAPSNCSENEIQGYGKTESCNWYGSFGDNSFVSIILTNGAVSSKTKTGF